ncbi:hypothetical protein KKE19_03470 [Patescibacteria group bacterium]|nr:hypothetical protein [Patescibacteria group bacterium]MBU4274847.1 hypothetical protein [Patescibacteria group bacterium]MBU4367984.1 hypothetical protein [Patescibacteria group bacterium]MBU4462165.1 hypothetical protein [Patescibacteria group bacterium]MCG2699828.1 hypothetical protein [Candidatus Parcubacteria bacterium]
MTTHTLTHSFPFSLIKLPKINWKAFLLLNFCVLLFLTVFYALQINNITNGSYLIKSYQKKIETLLQENNNLEINLAQISYLENVQEKTAELGFEKIQTIKYIQILDNSLAKK